MDDFRLRYQKAVGGGALLPMNLRSRKNVEASRVEQQPWDAAIPLPLLASASFPKLVVSGTWDGPASTVYDSTGRAYTATCDALAQQIKAVRAVIPGADHKVQEIGKPFNDRLLTFLATGA